MHCPAPPYRGLGWDESRGERMSHKADMTIRSGSTAQMSPDHTTSPPGDSDERQAHSSPTQPLGPEAPRTSTGPDWLRSARATWLRSARGGLASLGAGGLASL